MKTNQKYISSNEILEEIREIGDYKANFDSLSGVLEWYNSKKHITIYATPNWEENGLVPFDVSVDGRDYFNVCTIKMVNGSTSEQFLHYLNVLMMIMNNYDNFPTIEENK